MSPTCLKSRYIAARIYIAVTTNIAVVLAAAAVMQLLLDFGGVHDSPEDGGRAFLRPGTIVRERSAGFVFVTTRLYKPLP
eukprot:4184546-Pleurochrysis_carterae.AAC.1